jgi:hypothetical protein
MWRPHVDAGWSFIVAGGLVSTVAGHELVGALGTGGASPGDGYGGYRHVAVLPVFVVALAGVLLAGFALARTQRRSAPFGRSDGLVRGAVAIVRIDPIRLAAFLAGLQLGSLYLMEAYEHLAAFGALPDGLAWLGGDLPVTLAIHLTLAVATAFAARRCGRNLVAACDRLIAFVDAIVVSARRLLGRACRRHVFVRRQRVSRSAPRAFRCIGLRSPPIAA